MTARRSTPRRLTSGWHGLLWTTVLGACGGGRPAKPAPANPDVALVVDGIEVTRSEWDEYLPYVRSLQPEQGPHSIRQWLLTSVVLRMAIARRLYPTELERAHQQARDLARVCKQQGGVPALELYGGIERSEPVGRGDLSVEISRAIFALDEGDTTEAVLTPVGGVVAGVLEKLPGDTPLYDKVRIVIKEFAATDDVGNRLDLHRAIDNLNGKITYLAKDREDSVPESLKTNRP